MPLTDCVRSMGVTPVLNIDTEWQGPGISVLVPGKHRCSVEVLDKGLRHGTASRDTKNTKLV